VGSRRHFLLLLSLLLLLFLALSGCASAPLTKAEVTPGGAPLVMKAGNFSFDPDAVSVHGTGTLTLTIINTSATAHNITVDDPQGKVIDSAEIPPNATITTQVTFAAPGDYYFFCNHPFHADFGMKGHFIVSGS
jgi:plastocyanin